MDEKECEVEELEHTFTNESAEPIRISYSAIKSITKDFSQVIGHGGFGIVYLGALRNDALVAVKELIISQDFSDTQFLKEVKCLRRVKHENIARFLGYCAYTSGLVMKVQGEYKLVDEPKRFLCFEYAPNGNLQDYLKAKTHGYEWSICYKIIKGICQGLQYLHQERINHLDLKPANVLLGAQMKPKITDFGLSRCHDGIQSTIVTSNVQGTLGYMAPELIDERKVSSKADIFSLGIIMHNLLSWNNNDNITENGHALLNVYCQQMERCTEIAQICADNDPYKRPTISDIICMLPETETAIQNVPPVIITEPRNDPTTTLYKNVKIFLARPSQTGEYYRGPKKLRVERPKWKLAFQSPPKLPIITDEKIEDANGNPLEVILVDTDTGKPSALPNVLQIELVPLLGNFPRDCWDANDFQRGIVKDLKKKRPLLAGEYRFTMWDGRATVNKLMFTKYSLKCNYMYRIGVRIVPGSNCGARILEAITEAFMVRDRQSYELHCNKGLKWQLVFQSQPRLLSYAGCKITDVIGSPLEVILVDSETGSPSVLPMELHIQLVLVSPYEWARLKLLKYWSADEFQMGVFERSQPSLSGDVNLTMKDDGHVTVSNLQFTEQFSNIHIGVYVVSDGYNGPGRILEGMTHSFEVEYITTETNTKRYPPTPVDEVWRIRSISWGGESHKRLEQNNIRNVLDFLRMLAVKPEELRAIMGDDMEDDEITWESITDHARTCVFPGDKVYAYGTAAATIYVNLIFDLIKVEFGGMECPLQQQDDAQKRLMQQVTWEAYAHRHSLQEVEITWKLAFKSPPRLPIDAGSRITDAMGKPLEVILVDAKTGSPWALPMELRIHLVPLLGDFPPYDGKEDWSAEEFRTAIVTQRQKKVGLLKSSDERDNYIMMDGRVTVSEVLRFTDNSSWVRCRKFRIGAYVDPGSIQRYGGEFRIIEAMTEAFVVGDVNRKHYPPVLSDPVWRLEMIDKDGAVHRKLTSYNIDTVEELLMMRNVTPYRLRRIVDNVIMTDKMWRMTIRHANTCAPGNKVYAYSRANDTIYVDSIFDQLWKIEIDGVEWPLEQELDEVQRMSVKQLILEAYKHRHNLQDVGAAMELRNHGTIDIFWLLRGEHVPRAPKLVFPGPSREDGSSVS